MHSSYLSIPERFYILPLSIVSSAFWETKPSGIGTNTKGCGKQQRKQLGRPGGNDPETQKGKKNRDTGETIGAGKEGNNLEGQGETIVAARWETTGMPGETK